AAHPIAGGTAVGAIEGEEVRAIVAVERVELDLAGFDTLHRIAPQDGRLGDGGLARVRTADVPDVDASAGAEERVEALPDAVVAIIGIGRRRGRLPQDVRRIFRT